MGSQHCHRGSLGLMVRQHPAKSRVCQQWSIAAEDNEPAFSPLLARLKDLLRLRDRVPGAEPSCLHDRHDITASQYILDLFGLMPGDHRDASLTVFRQGLRQLNGIENHRPAADGMEHLREFRAHARSLTSR